MLVFPEGTTTNGSGLLDFRTGAFVAAAPVLPAVIRYETAASAAAADAAAKPASPRAPRTRGEAAGAAAAAAATAAPRDPVAWTTQPSTLRWLVGVLCAPRKVATVRLLPPLAPDDAAARDDAAAAPRAFADACRAAMAEQLGPHGEGGRRWEGWDLARARAFWAERDATYEKANRA